MPLSQAQENIVKDENRFRVAVTGRRFGKTHTQKDKDGYECHFGAQKDFANQQHDKVCV